MVACTKKGTCARLLYNESYFIQTKQVYLREQRKVKILSNFMSLNMMMKTIKNCTLVACQPPAQKEFPKWRSKASSEVESALLDMKFLWVLATSASLL